MRALLLSLSLFAAAIATASTTLYKWVDKNGVVHYSDRPAPGAVAIEVKSAQGYEAPPKPAAASPQAAKKPGAADAGYQKLDLWKPENNETLTNTGNTVTVRVRLEPELRPGDTIWIYLDGKRVDGLPATGEAFELKEVWRGSHTVSAVVSDSNGKVLIKSQSVTFNIFQTNLLSPGSRINQAKPPSAGTHK